MSMPIALILLLASPQEDPPSLISKAVTQLLSMQEDGGAWPYEGVYRVNREIPVGYRIGGTSIVASTLMHAAPTDEKARQAVEKGLTFVLKNLGDPLMRTSVEDVYDVRIWGHATALEFLCHVKAAKVAGDRAKEVDGWIGRLVNTIATEELLDGGWNYAGRERPASFVTAVVVQALLFAKGQGFEVQPELLDRAKKSLERARADSGAFLYGGVFKEG